MKSVRLFLVVLSAALFSPAFAENTKSLSPVPPDGFQFSGTWICEGAFGNKQVHKSMYAGTTILGGKWLELSEADLEPSTNYVAKYLIGYDPQQKRLVEFDANSFGAAIYTSEDGWQNHTLTMTSAISQDAKAPYVANRFVFTATGKDTFTVDWKISKRTPLEWITSDHLACNRQVLS